jgi:hypothetical protein
MADDGRSQHDKNTGSLRPPLVLLWPGQPFEEVDQGPRGLSNGFVEG